MTELEERHPSPWKAVYDETCADNWLVVDAKEEYVAGFGEQDLAESIVLQNNAAWVQEQTGWTTRKWETGRFGVVNGWGDHPHELHKYENNACPTPALALWEAWLWKEKQK